MNSIIPRTSEEVENLAKLYFTASHVKSKHKTLGNVAYVILYCLEHDINITEGLQFIYLIGDKLAAQAELLLSMVYRSNKLKSFNEEIVGRFKDGTAKAVCTIHRDGFDKKVFTFSIADAKKARLWERNPVWKGYPQRMLTMKARTYALKDICTDIIGGLISEDEARDIVFHKKEPNNITPNPKMLPEQNPESIDNNEEENSVVSILETTDKDSQGLKQQAAYKKKIVQAESESFVKNLDRFNKASISGAIDNKVNDGSDMYWKGKRPGIELADKQKLTIHDSKILDEKFVIDSDGSYHMKSGVVLERFESEKMKDMNPAEKKAYYELRKTDPKTSKNLYLEMFPETTEEK